MFVIAFGKLCLHFPVHQDSAPFFTSPRHDTVISLRVP